MIIPSKLSFSGILFYLFLGVTTGTTGENFISGLTRTTARSLFQQALEKEQKTGEVLEQFQADTLLPRGVRMVYSGALQTLKTRDAFFPHSKMKWLNRGMAALESALRVLTIPIKDFVYGYLLFFLNAIVFEWRSSRSTESSRE
ncbi:MAG: hypothetical protein Kow0042_16190 [Calditrichia bacterium]